MDREDEQTGRGYSGDLIAYCSCQNFWGLVINKLDQRQWVGNIIYGIAKSC